MTQEGIPVEEHAKRESKLFPQCLLLSYIFNQLFFDIDFNIWSSLIFKFFLIDLSFQTFFSDLGDKSEEVMKVSTVKSCTELLIEILK